MFLKKKIGESSSLPMITTEDDITEKNLEPGDHIFSERMKSGYSYSHHGIYIGDNTVIHLQGPHKHIKNGSEPLCGECGYVPKREGTVVKTCLSCFSAGSSLNIRLYAVHVTRNKIENWILDKIRAERLVYIFDRKHGGVEFGIWAHGLLHRSDGTGLEECLAIETTRPHRHSRRCKARCLDCFLGDGLLYIHEKRVQGEWQSMIDHQAMNADRRRFFVQSNGSKRVQICKLTSKKIPEKVVETATELLEKGYSNYHLIRNNCEHFTVHCKTGLAMSIQVEAFSLGRLMDRMLRATVKGYVPTLEDRMDHGHCKMNQMIVRTAGAGWFKRLRLRVCTAVKKSLLLLSPTKTTTPAFDPDKDFSFEDLRLDECLCKAKFRWKEPELDAVSWLELLIESDFEEFMGCDGEEESLRCEIGEEL